MDNVPLELALNLPAIPSKPDLRGRLLATRSDTAADLLATARTQIEASRSARTRAAYQSDWGLFSAWCASVGADPLPASIETVSAYSWRSVRRVTPMRRLSDGVDQRGPQIRWVRRS